MIVMVLKNNDLFGLKETPVDQIGQLAALSGEVFIVNNEEMSVAGCQ